MIGKRTGTEVICEFRHVRRGKNGVWVSRSSSAGFVLGGPGGGSGWLEQVWLVAHLSLSLQKIGFGSAIFACKPARLLSPFTIFDIVLDRMRLGKQGTSSRFLSAFIIFAEDAVRPRCAEGAIASLAGSAAFRLQRIRRRLSLFDAAKSLGLHDLC